MSTLETLVEVCQFNRSRTHALLKSIEEAEDPQAALGWRPGPQRAHIAWQLVHVGITEELFATQQLAQKDTARHQDLWERFRGGSTPDNDIPDASTIRQVLEDGREQLLETLADFNDDQLSEIVWTHPQSNRDLTLLTVLHILNWHEGHHQGQAHITLNLFRAQAD